MKLNKISAEMVSRRPDQTAEWLNRLSRQVDIIEAEAESTKNNPYTLPIASAYTLGAIKVGSNLSITPEGVLSALAPVSYDYNLLFNKPQINSVTLTGNTSLHDLGIDIPTKTSELINNGADNTSTYVEHDELATVATSGSYADLINKPTIGNATLTIQKNSTDVGTFTANATSNKTIDISVPTRTSDITNNGADGTSTYVEADDLATVATTGSYNDLLDQPTIGDATLTIQRNGATAQTFTANSTTNKSVDIQAPIRVDLSNSTQTSAWHRSVIALCEVTTADKVEFNSFSGGKITFHRSNGLDGVAYIDVYIENAYSVAYTFNFSYTSNLNLLASTTAGITSTGFRPCVFKKDDVWYAGVEVYLSPAQYQHVFFDGECRGISIFGLDYYSPEHSSGGTSYPAEVLDQEVYDSIDFTKVVWKKETLMTKSLRLDDGTIKKGGAYTATLPNQSGTLAMTSDIGNATLTIQKNGTNVDTFTANATSNKTINITVPTTAADVGALPDSTKYAANLSLTINSSTFVVTGQLKDQDGNNLGSAQTIDLPLESVVVSGSYDSATKEVVLVLESGSEIRFSVADLVSGLQTEITVSNPLDADLVDDSTSTNKFVTSSDITTWNGKQDALTAGSNIQINGTTISATDTTYSAGSGIALNGTTFSADTSVVQEKLTAGSNITISGATISAADTTYSDFIGASSGTAGAAGLVPAPAAGDDTKYLSGDGLWKTVSQYSLPIASDTTLGGVKIGNNLTIDSLTGVLDATDTTYSAGSGITLAGTTFSADTSVMATNEVAQDFAVQEGSTQPVFEGMTPVQTFEWDVSDTVYRPIYQIDNTGWDYTNMDITVAYRITVTGTGIKSVTDVIDRWFNPISWPLTSALHKTLSTSAGTTGFRYLRAVYPTASYLNNTTYPIGQEIYMYNGTARHVLIEVFKTNSNVTWNTTKPSESIYKNSTTYQGTNSMDIYATRGWHFRKPANFTANNADAAVRISDYEPTVVGNSAILNGPTALVSGHLAFLAEDGKVYDISNTTKAISVGEAKMGFLAGGINANATMTSTYWRAIYRPNATQYGYFNHDTMALGDRVYLRCTMDSSGKIYSDNYLAKDMAPGYTWMPMGVMTASDTFYADVRFPMFYTLNSVGKITHVNGKKTTPDITITNTDPGEGVSLGEDEYIAVYGSPSMIGTSRLENGAVTTTKIDANAVTAAKIDFSTLNFGNYSNTEQDTGFTWLDGSPIYKKTITHTTGLAAGSNNVPHGITNLGIVVNKEIIGYDSVNSTTAQIPMATFSSSTPSGNSISAWTVTTTDVQIYSSFAYSNTVYITLYYTKSS